MYSYGSFSAVPAPFLGQKLSSRSWRRRQEQYKAVMQGRNISQGAAGKEEASVLPGSYKNTFFFFLQYFFFFFFL